MTIHPPSFDAFKAQHDAFLKTLKDEYMHREVTLIDVWPRIARGRAARIEGIIIDRGEPLFLCMVLRSGSEMEFLNGPVWSRCYRSWSEFVFSDGES